MKSKLIIKWGRAKSLSIVVLIGLLSLAGCSTTGTQVNKLSEKDRKKALVRSELRPVIHFTVASAKYHYQAVFRQIEAEPIWERIPTALHPATLMTDEVTEHLVVIGFASRLTEQDIIDFGKLFNTEAGEFLLGRMEKAMRNYPNRSPIAEGLTPEQIRYYENQLTSIVPLPRIKEMFDRIQGVGQAMSQIGLGSFKNYIYKYYRSRPFTETESKLCEDLFNLNKAVYAIAVCDAGRENKDYRSTLYTAKLYWQGRNFLRPQNIDYAIELLEGLALDDKTGEANYYLGMLLKNKATDQMGQVNSYCSFKRAEKLGYQEASSMLAEFDSDLNASCKV